MNKIRRINLFSGAGAGKSLTASNIYVQLSCKGYDIEFVEEVIKDWTYIQRVPIGCDGIYLQSSQIQKEDIRLRSGVNLIVTDSPLVLQYFYALHYNSPLQEAMHSASKEFEKLYPSINIFINREDKFYNEVGRYETLEEAKEIDTELKGVLESMKIKYVQFSCLDQNKIMEYIISKVGKDV